MTTKNLVDRILSQIKSVAFAARYWDGERVAYGTGPIEFELDLVDERACRRMLSNLPLRFGEAYVSGAIDIRGDLERLTGLMFAPELAWPSLGLAETVRLALSRVRPRRPSLARARREVAPHYDLGNDFFKLWLGKEMVYSCAYFRDAQDDLDTAQAQKFRHLCAKLRLEPGERLLDIGCGWGGFLIHAATHHRVQALGLTLSEQQKREADDRIAAHGLTGRVAVELLDYRQLATGEGFDKIVSIGMFEHVGRRGIPEYFRHTRRLLKDGGIGVLHTIGRRVATPPNPWLTTYIFPRAYFPSLAEITEPLGEQGLDVTDVEVLRLHYALTLERWLEAFENHVETIRNAYGEPFVRMWRLYLASCAASFRYGDFCVWQVQFSKDRSVQIPLTRDYLYRSP